MASPHPVLLVGVAAFFTGAALVMAALFANGGANKSQQFRVIGEVLSGAHGHGWRLATQVGLAALGVGLLTTFTGVALGDRARARRCQEHCAQQGYARGVIGPSAERQPGRPNAAAFVACRCEGGREGTTETRADDL